MRGRLWVGVLVTTSVAIADPVLDRPAFTASPADLLALARAAPAGDWPVVILRDQSEISYDDRGRATTRWRFVFAVQTRAGIDGWGTLRSEWMPFYQDRPKIRARVIDPAGNATALDPALISDAPGTRAGANVLSDRRRLEAPLPRLQVGSVVEQEVVVVDREPLFAAGTVDTTPIGSGVPTSSTVIEYSVPAALARTVHRVERKLPPGVHARHRVANVRESWTYEIGPLPARPEAEPAVPGDVIVQPYVGVATGVSWPAVARAYRAVIDQRIADGPVALPADLPHAASLDAVRAIAGWVRHQVRYTGIELGQASNVPWPPAETLKRGFGDCKDMATLLVALLRGAGVRADLALLNAGGGLDVDADLPGMGAFDHAIVRVRVDERKRVEGAGVLPGGIDGGDIWIDPTEELMPPGQLPVRDQGRRALVIADDTTGLSTTPASAPADNAIREIRTFTAAEHGPSQLAEIDRLTGVSGAHQRAWFRDARGDEINKVYGGYAEQEFAGKLDRVATSKVEDTSAPFEVTIAVKDVRRVFTERDRIDVNLYPGAVLDRVPSLVTQASEAPRTLDFAWPVPHVYEVENRIVVPHGFTMPSPGPDRTRALGPATLTESRRVEGQTLIVVFRFDSGKPRLTAGELAALQSAVRAARDEVIHIAIEHTAIALGDAGKLRDAIAECQRLIALHPRESVHHRQLATVLMRAGAGGAARRAARAAVALAPSEADPLVVLGWALSFDTLGRRFTHDWDRAGAIAALQKARQLDPSHIGAADELAEVLTRDPFGRAAESGADLKGAVEARRGAFALDRSDEHALALARALMWTGQFTEAEQLARSAKQTDQRDALIVVATAGASGAKAAIRAAGDLATGAARTTAIATAAQGLLVLQRYDVARDLVAEAGAAVKLPVVAEVLQKVQSQPAVKPGSSDPRSAVADLIHAMIDPKHRTPVFWDARLDREFRDAIAKVFPPLVRAGGGLRFIEDFLRSTIAVQIEGDGGLWRATLDGWGKRDRVYLVLDRGIVKLVGAPDSAAAVGRYVLATLDDPRAEPRARKLLQWLRDDLDHPSAQGDLWFKRLWGSGLPSTRDAIAMAAAMLAGTSDLDRASAVAQRCPSTLPDAELACHELLLEAGAERGRWSDALTQLDAILKLRPDRAAKSTRMRAWLLAQAGRVDEADKLLDDALARDPADREAIAGRVAVAEAAGQLAQAVQRSDALVNIPNPTAQDLNNAAWLRLFAGIDLPIARELARKAIKAAPIRSNAMNTLAAVEAELGELDDAVRDNWKAIELERGDAPADADWYVVGRIDEQLGLAADAEAAYKRVTRSDSSPLSAYQLAQRRLAAMRRSP